MSRLYEALAAIERKARVLARTDLPGFPPERRARPRQLVLALGAVVAFGAVALPITLRAPPTPLPSAPAVPPLPPAQRPEPLRAPELRERAREATVLGSLARAEELLERAVTLDPTDPSTWNELGVVLVRRGQLRLGMEALQKSLALDPKHAEAHRNLAVALERDGQTLASAVHYREFLALAPAHPDRAQIEERLSVPGPTEARR